MEAVNNKLSQDLAQAQQDAAAAQAEASKAVADAAQATEALAGLQAEFKAESERQQGLLEEVTQARAAEATQWASEKAEMQDKSEKKEAKLQKMCSAGNEDLQLVQKEVLSLEKGCCVCGKSRRVLAG